ncbi:MAG: hypothetical protein ACOYOK_15320, partial [Pseudobdellovibrionaceae bacterium]
MKIPWMKNFLTGILSASFVFLQFSVAEARRKETSSSQDLLIKLANEDANNPILVQLLKNNTTIESLGGAWYHVTSRQISTLRLLQNSEEVLHVQKNFKLRLLEDYQIKDRLRRAALARMIARQKMDVTPSKEIVDNLPLPTDIATPVKGTDPLLTKQWGLLDIGVESVWKNNPTQKPII